MLRFFAICGFMFIALTNIVSAQTILQNNVARTNLAGALASKVFFKISVPQGQSKLDVKLAATFATGDCDLYVKFGSTPTLSTWDYRPYLGDANETVSVNNPAAGDWYIMLDGFQAYAGLSLVATYGGAQRVLQNSVAVTNLAAAQGAQLFFKITVPQGQSQLEIKLATTFTTGDSDLYVRFGASPTLSDWDYRPYLGDANEVVTIPNPAAGDWYIMLDGFQTFSGLTLIATYTATQGIAATPTFNVPGGSYTGEVVVSLATATSGALIRYTTNGTDPTTSSTIYSAPIILSSTVILKARAFMSGLTQSAVASATYTIIPSNVTVLQNGVARTGLAGALDSQTVYKIFVPPGQTSLVIAMTGTSGDCDLYVKHGAQPTLATFDYRPYLGDANETVTVLNPAGGDWFLMLHGYTAYTGVRLIATYSASSIALPDLVPFVTSLNAYTRTESFTAGACDALEGLVATGTRRLLRFSTEVRNMGNADMVLRSPVNNPLFTYAPCHGHYHFNNFAEYQLLNDAGQLVAAGQKVGFCLEDFSRWSATANSRPQYDCDYQGIQVGWSDIYNGNLPGQWIDITGVPPGTYTLQIRIDTANRIAESNENNNTARARVTIQATDGRVTSQPLPP